MGTLDIYRQIVQKVLAAYADIPYAYGDVHTEVFCDRNADRYLLMTVGWDQDNRVHGCLVHIDIIDGKLWIQRDGTEQGIATELVAAGIPKSSIVLTFHPPEIRCHTDYAVA
jgi:XisI protein